MNVRPNYIKYAFMTIEIIWVCTSHAVTNMRVEAIGGLRMKRNVFLCNRQIHF